jgi:hypothetical protein
VQKQGPEQPALVREAGAATGQGAPGNDSVVTTAEVKSSARPDRKRTAGAREKLRNGKGIGDRPGGDQNDSGDNAQSSSGGHGDDNGTSGNPGNENPGDDTGSSGGSDDPAPSPGGATTTTNPIKNVTDTVQKPVQQITEQVTDAIPTLPGKDPVSQTVNNTVAGVKDTLGKLTGKP